MNALLADKWMIWPLRAIAVIYAYGALVHLQNMLSLSGFDWPSAPLRWQVMDVIYLLLDVAVVFGVWLRRWFGLPALLLAAASQIVLYTAFRSWMLDVTPALAVVEDPSHHLDGLVWFHAATLAIVTALSLWRLSSMRRVADA